MQFERDTIIEHFRHVHTGGLVEEAVFYGQFESQALTVPGTVLALAEGLRDAEPLPYRIGLGDLGRVVRGLETMTEAACLHNS